MTTGECEDGLCLSRGNGHRGEVRRVLIRDLRSPYTREITRNCCAESIRVHALYGFSCTPTESNGEEKTR